MPTPFPRRRALTTLLGRVWASPNTLLGILLGLINGNVPRRHDDAFDIILGEGIVAACCNALGVRAFTVGDCILWNSPPHAVIRRHEMRHVAQFRVLGPFFLPVYFLLLAVCGYWKHPLERDAREHEGESS